MAYALMGVFFIIPYLEIDGRPLLLLDLPRREFTLFGHVFLSTDTFLFMLLFLSVAIGIFLVTALLGRVWCGWACPQTVYLEFLFRPIEYWLEGGPRGVAATDVRRGISARRFAKYAIYGALAMFLSHTFLAYFVGVETLVKWVQTPPVEHPTTFFIMAGTTALIFFDFTYFREQTCLVACPYGRLQSVLLDRSSLIVGYDRHRGEPRKKGTRDRTATAGDCIDCQMCVTTCPTGIDIRDGLQMECIHCTQCVDACDRVMLKIGKPAGLIRYSSREALEGLPQRMIRARVILYPIALLAALGTLVWTLANTVPADVTLLRGTGAPYAVEPDGTIANPIRIKITNRSRGPRKYQIDLVNLSEATLVAPINPFPVPEGKTQTTAVFVLLPADEFHDGLRPFAFRISDGVFTSTFPYQLVGPDDGELSAESSREPERRGHSHSGSDR